MALEINSILHFRFNWFRYPLSSLTHKHHPLVSTSPFNPLLWFCVFSPASEKNLHQQQLLPERCSILLVKSHQAVRTQIAQIRAHYRRDTAGKPRGFVPSFMGSPQATNTSKGTNEQSGHFYSEPSSDNLGGILGTLKLVQSSAGKWGSLILMEGSKSKRAASTGPGPSRGM